MVWTREKILRSLRRLHKSGADLSYNALAKRNQKLLSAAAYHFSSYPRAVERAGIDYAECARRPRWTKASIIALIKHAKRHGEDLHWTAVVKRDDELARAAFASLQPRLFGKWVRALRAAGIDADDVGLYRTWDADAIVSALRDRRRKDRSMNSGDVQKDDPALHAAALRHFASFDAALRAAHIDPMQVRRRRSWDRASVVRGLRLASRRQANLSDSFLRKSDPALFGAARRVYGSLARARSAAGI